MKDRKIRKVEDFIFYQEAIELFYNFIEEDLPVLQKTLAGRELARQQVCSLDSICSNMEEGYGEESLSWKRFKPCYIRLSQS